MRSETTSEFEAAVLKWIASNTTDSALRLQLAEVQVLERNHTGAGCYSQLELPDDAPRTRRTYGSHGPVDGPHFESPAVLLGGGTLLWFKNGLADCLEIYTYDGYFPEVHKELSPFRLTQSA